MGKAALCRAQHHGACAMWAFCRESLRL